MQFEDSAASCVAPELIVPLAGTLDEKHVGGKARNLARLLQLGAPVPPAVVITDRALQEFLDHNDLAPALAAMREDLHGKSPLAIRCASDTIAALIRDSSVPPCIDAVVRTCAEALPGTTLIVRSSAVGEDSAAASFAGQLDTMGDVTGPDLLRRALISVWTSRWSERALSYEIARSATLAGMGVIVQQQIDARLSGVLFTRDPVDPARIRIEYCPGMGEALVSGRENPASLSVSRHDLVLQPTGNRDRGLNHVDGLLDRPHLEVLCRWAVRIEEAFGAPQDIEWTIGTDGRLWIVQTRPITTSQSISRDSDVAPRAADHSPDSSGETALVHWSNANVNENFPSPICPLLYSIAAEGYYHYFRNLGRAFGVSRERLAAMEQPMRHIIGVHGARMYYNLTSIHGILRSAPFGDLLSASFDQFVGSDPTPTRAAIPFAGRARRHLTQAMELGTIVLRITSQYLFLTRRVERFERTVDAFAEQTHPSRLATRPIDELLHDFRAFLDIRCNRWNGAALADAASMVCYAVLQRLLSRAFPDLDQQALHNSVLKALPGLVSGRPALELWDLSREIRANAVLRDVFESSSSAQILERVEADPALHAFRRRLHAFNEQWGFRCPSELMLTVPCFQEDPEPLVDLLRMYARLDTESPAALLDRQQIDRIATTNRIIGVLRHRPLAKYLPFVPQSAIVSLVLRWTQKSILLRERARLKQALLYSRFRRIVLAIGSQLVEQGRVDHRDDLFFLTASEIDALLSGSAMFPDHVKALVALRRAAHVAVSATAPPDKLTLAPGEYFQAAPADAPRASPRAPELHGVGACGGRVTGSAAVLRHVGESHLLPPGAVLVTRQTDPGWGPVFPLISGLVMERGGMLSHGAIIAREFGIPSVVAVEDATRIIQTGMVITVNGDRGTVRIAGEAAAC